MYNKAALKKLKFQWYATHYHSAHKHTHCLLALIQVPAYLLELCVLPLDYVYMTSQDIWTLCCVNIYTAGDVSENLAASMFSAVNITVPGGEKLLRNVSKNILLISQKTLIFIITAVGTSIPSSSFFVSVYDQNQHLNQQEFSGVCNGDIFCER
jgi:hypothetical protein